MIIISAMTESRVIGLGTGMPWEVPEEYAQYLNFVRGQTVIMGRRTYEIFGQDLDRSQIIVVSRSLQSAEAQIASSFPAAVELARLRKRTVFVAGGSSIYQAALPLADAMYLSTIKGEYEGDVYFPEFDPNQWLLAEERDEGSYIFRNFLRPGTSPRAEGDPR